MNNFQAGDDIEQAFSCYIVQNFNEAEEKVKHCYQILEKHFTGLSDKQHIEKSFRVFLRCTSTVENHTRMKCLFSVINQLMENGILSSR